MTHPPYPRKIFTAPTIEPVGLEELRDQVRMGSSTTFDDKLTRYGRIAREHVERLSQTQLLTAVWKVYPPSFPSSCEDIDLPLYPLQSVDSLTVTDVSGAVATWTPLGGDLVDSSSVVRAHVDTISEPGRIVLPYGQLWPVSVLKRSNPIEIKITNGYGGANDVPGQYKLAILYLVAHFFENAEAVTIGTLMESKELILGVKDLIAPIRTWGF